MTQNNRLIVGKISGIYGVRGWVRIFSETSPRDNILNYSPWQVLINNQWTTLAVVEGRAHNKGVVVHLEGYDDRDIARNLIGAQIAIDRDRLTPLEKGEYYWTDLIGCRVVTIDDTELGYIDHLFETGANDVIVIKGERERLVPFIQGQVIKTIDLEKRILVVDWDPDF